MHRLKRVLIGFLLLLAVASVAAAQGSELPPMAGSPPGVPEPATWMLTVTGIGVLALMLRRRRK